jgi:hypothetical protein
MIDKRSLVLVGKTIGIHHPTRDRGIVSADFLSGSQTRKNRTFNLRKTLELIGRHQK